MTTNTNFEGLEILLSAELTRAKVREYIDTQRLAGVTDVSDESKASKITDHGKGLPGIASKALDFLLLRGNIDETHDTG